MRGCPPHRACSYYVAGVCIVMNVAEKRQRFFTCHRFRCALELNSGIHCFFCLFVFVVVEAALSVDLTAFAHSDNVVSLALHKKFTRASGATGAWVPSRAMVRGGDCDDDHHNDSCDVQGYTEDDVGCRTLAASGELGQHPKIYVWDTQTCLPLKELKGIHRCDAAARNNRADFIYPNRISLSFINIPCPHAWNRRGVLQLDFTRDGRFLISVGLDDSHTAGATRDSWLCAAASR